MISIVLKLSFHKHVTTDTTRSNVTATSPDDNGDMTLTDAVGGEPIGGGNVTDIQAPGGLRQGIHVHTSHKLQ